MVSSLGGSSLGGLRLVRPTSHPVAISPPPASRLSGSNMPVSSLVVSVIVCADRCSVRHLGSLKASLGPGHHPGSPDKPHNNAATGHRSDPDPAGSTNPAECGDGGHGLTCCHRYV